jgi:hypothetical protein
VEDPLSEEILKGNVKENMKVRIKMKKGSDEFIFESAVRASDTGQSDEISEESGKKE